MAPQLTLVPQKCIIFDVFTTSTKASEPTNIISLNTPVCSMPHANPALWEKKIALHHLIVVNTVCVRVKSTVQVTKLQTIFSPGRCYGILCSTLCSLWCSACFKNQTNEKKLNQTNTQACLPACMAWCECGVCARFIQPNLMLIKYFASSEKAIHWHNAAPFHVHMNFKW